MLVQRLTLICCSLSGELGRVRWLVPARCAFKGDECCAFKGDECAFKGDEWSCASRRRYGMLFAIDPRCCFQCAFKGDECCAFKGDECAFKGDEWSCASRRRYGM